MRRCQLILSLIVIVASAAAAAAQPRPSGTAVTGVVVDATGAVLPNAQIELTTATGTAVQSTVADESGAFRIDRVAPGRYDIRAIFDGFQPTTVHITVGNRALAPLRVTMPIAGISQVVTVGTTAAEVSKNAAANLDASTVDQKGIENLPLFNQDVLATMSRFLDSSAIGTNGATLVVNGIEVNNLNVSASAIQQIKVNQDPYSAEYPRPGRGRIEVVLKLGSQDYHGIANVLFRDSRLDQPNAYATVKPEEQRRMFEGFLSGPIGHSDNTSFMLSAKDNADDTQSIVVAQGLSGPINLNVPSPYRNVLIAGTLNHQRSDNTTMSLTASYQGQTMKNQGVVGVTLPSAGTNWSFTEESVTYTQQTIITPKLLNQFRLVVGQEFEPTTSVSTDPKVVVLDAFTGGGAQADSLRTEHHFTLTNMLTWSAGQHVVKAGINIPDWSRRRFDDNTNFGGTYYFSRLSDYAAARPYSLIQQAGNGHVAFLEKVVGLFVQDEVRLGPRVSASIGLRYDWQNYFHDANNVGPRGSVVFALTGDGRTLVRAGAGAFYDRSGPRPMQDILRYNGVQLLRYVINDPAYPNAAVSGAPSSVVQLSPDIVLP
jgi:carboxypeptidase family protein/TonB-dependent receptor-like protein